MKNIYVIVILLVSTNLFSQQVNFNPRNSIRQFESITAPIGLESTGFIVVNENGTPNYSKSLQEIRKVRTASIDEARKQKLTDLQAGIRQEIAINKMDTTIIHAYKLSQKKYYQVFGIKPTFLPVRNRFLSRIYYSQNIDGTLETLKNNSVSISSKLQNGSIYSELVAGYFLLFRIGFGAMISQTEIRSISSDEINNLNVNELDALRKSIDSLNSANLTAQNILAGGGNLLLNASLPILDFSTAGKDLSFKIAAYERLGFAVPNVGSTSENIQFINQIGLQGETWLDLDFLGDRDFAFGIMGLVSYVSNDQYAGTLGINDKSFTFLEVTPILEIDRRFRIFVNFPKVVNSQLNSSFKTNIGVQILPFYNKK